MPPSTGSDALNKAGMPPLHATCFQTVANLRGCVVSSRDIGQFSGGLLLESYASKSFHDKAKTSNWGPMAGIVVADPRLGKGVFDPKLKDDSLGSKAFLTQKKEVHKALAKKGGDLIPLYISEERRLALEKLHAMEPNTAAGGGDGVLHYRARPPKSDADAVMNFVLRRTLQAPGADGKPMWEVLYGPDELQMSADGPAQRSKVDHLLPVMAVVDPKCPERLRGTYRSATTGDYDLFAVMPPAAGRRVFQQKHFDFVTPSKIPGRPPHVELVYYGRDARPVSGSDMRAVNDGRTLSMYEDPDMGNITPRVRSIVRRLNDELVHKGGYDGGDCVHHSDEAGRPFVTAIEFPFIAFVPKRQTPYTVSNVTELKEFLGELKFEYFVPFNPGWHKQLGIDVQGRSYEYVGDLSKYTEPANGSGAQSNDNAAPEANCDPAPRVEKPAAWAATPAPRAKEASDAVAWL